MKESLSTKAFVHNLNWTVIAVTVMLIGLVTVGEPDIIDGVTGLLASLAENLGK